MSSNSAIFHLAAIPLALPATAVIMPQVFSDLTHHFFIGYVDDVNSQFIGDIFFGFGDLHFAGHGFSSPFRIRIIKKYSYSINRLIFDIFEITIQGIGKQFKRIDLERNQDAAAPFYRGAGCGAVNDRVAYDPKAKVLLHLITWNN
jgi:hypothetical protein